MFVTYFSLICLFSFVQARMSLEDVKAVINEINENMMDNSILNSTIINIVFGYLFEAIGALDSLRFFGPGIKVIMNENGRNYSDDSSEDPLIQLLIELFPSPSGILCYVRNKPTNFGFKFNKDQDKGVEFLADMFIRILKKQEKQKTGVKSYENFKLVESLFLNTSSCGMLDRRLIKLIAIHAFILNATNTRDTLKKYLNLILYGLKESGIKLEKLNLNITDNVIKIENRFKIFPYSETNQPASNTVIPVYNRETDTFNETKTFSDCVDVFFLNLCNCIFYDSENYRYSTGNLDPDSDLAKFYQKYNKLFEITDDVRRDWSKVIRGLNDSIHKLHLIEYNINEAYRGIISMMNVLIKICNVNHRAFWKDFDGSNKMLQKKLKRLFDEITPKFPNQKLSIPSDSINFIESNTPHRRDFKNEFTLCFELPNDTLVKILVEQSLQHANMKVISYITNKMPNKLKINYSSIPKNSIGIVFKTYLKLADANHQLYLDLNILEQIYFSGPCTTNEQKVEKLKIISDAIVSLIEQGSNVTELRSKLNNILYSYLCSVNLNDEGTKSLFQPFLFNFENLSNEEIIECWETSLDVENSQVSKIWEEKVKDYNMESINFDISHVSIFYMPTLFGILKKWSALTKASFRGIDESQAEIFSKQLCKLENLKELSFLFNEFSETNVEFISNALARMTNLRALNLKRNHLKSEGAKYVVKALKHLPNLSHLDLSDNNFVASDSEHIAKALESLPNLVYLDLSDNNFGSGSLSYFANSFAKLVKLETLIFSNNSIQNAGMELIASELKNLTKLKSINFSSNHIEIQGAMSLIESCRELKNIESIDISSNNFSLEDEEKMSNEVKQFLDPSKVKVYLNSSIYRQRIIASEQAKKIVCAIVIVYLIFMITMIVLFKRSC